MIKLFTIGFTGKSAEKFFGILKRAGVKKIIDIRISNSSQLAGFTKGNDLKYFAKEIANISYEHNLDYAPTKELMHSYREKEITQDKWEVEYLKLLKERKILKDIDYKHFNNAVLLCSEEKAEHCHRNLLAQYLKKNNKEIEIIHL
ncbi:MAG TPA: DUF488 domain-containing protein [Ignavibacteriaceae bacterium]|nr:DUF488 domain-containing protein [Ignavibacteriaceae bacterium]